VLFVSEEVEFPLMRALRQPINAVDGLRVKISVQTSREIAKILLVALGYYLAVVASIQLRFGDSSLSILWPSNAILVAALILSPRKRWWTYLLAVVPVHILVMASLHVGGWWIAYQIAHNTVLSVAIASVLRTLEPRVERFERLREVLNFFTVAVLVPGIVSFVATLPIIALAPHSALLRHGWQGGLLVIWGGRWLTNAVSMLIFVPVILTGITAGAELLRGVPARRYVEAGVLGLALVSVSFMAFGGIQTSAQIQHALFLAPLPLLLWAAVRFGSTGVSWSIAALVCVSSWLAFKEEGPFAQSTSVDRAISMQLFWILLAGPFMSLAAVIKEHDLASATLTESEDRFSHLFEQSSVGIALESLEGRLCHVNPAFCSIFGYSANELLQLSCASLSHPEDAAMEAPLFQELLDGQRTSYQIEKRFFRKDGSEIWGQVSVSLLKGTQAKAPLVIGMLKDITERKLAESQLRASETRLHSTLDLLPARILIVDEMGNIIETNARCRELAAREGSRYPNFKVGKNLFVLCASAKGTNAIPARDVAMSVLQLLKGEPQKDLPLQLCHASNRSRVWFKVSMARFEEYDCPRVVLSYRDVTEMILTREELAKNKQHLSIALEVSHGGTWEWDIVAGTLHWSDGQAWPLQLGQTRFDGQLLRLLQSIPVEDREEINQVVARALQEDSSFAFQFRVTHPDSETRWILARGKIARNPEGQAVKMLGVNVDITDLKRRDSELQQLTGRLIQAQEEERHRISRELHDDIGQQVAVLADDLDSLSRELSGTGPSQVGDQAQTLHRRASELATGIHKLSHELHSSRLQHLGLVAALRELCGKFLSQRRIDIVLRADDFPENLPQDVALCVFRIAQESLNNIVKHSSAQKVTMVLTQQDGLVRLTIADDGIGFNPLAPCTGIGLTSMRERLRLVGGNLAVKSAHGAGTEIRAEIKLPALRRFTATASD
jgi:PAS domain S-box-containing protein